MRFGDAARLILVRHAAVELRDDEPPEAWQLRSDGRDAAARLAAWSGWRNVMLVASSPEPKAFDTAAPIAAAAGVELRVESDLREAGRPRRPVASRVEYVALASAYLRGEPLAGWEPASEVRQRVVACIDRLVAVAQGDVAVVSHGLALSLLLALEPVEWERFPLPAVAVADPRTRRILRPWARAEDFVPE